MKPIIWDDWKRNTMVDLKKLTLWLEIGDGQTAWHWNAAHNALAFATAKGVNRFSIVCNADDGAVELLAMMMHSSRASYPKAQFTPFLKVCWTNGKSPPTYYGPGAESMFVWQRVAELMRRFAFLPSAWRRGVDCEMLRERWKWSARERLIPWGHVAAEFVLWMDFTQPLTIYPGPHFAASAKAWETAFVESHSLAVPTSYVVYPYAYPHYGADDYYERYTAKGLGPHAAYEWLRTIRKSAPVWMIHCNPNNAKQWPIDQLRGVVEQAQGLHRGTAVLNPSMSGLAKLPEILEVLA